MSGEIDVADLRSQIAALKELMLARFDWEEKARQTAYGELQRHLTDLNHAHDNMVNDRTEFLRGDVHDRFYAEYKTFRDEANKAIGERLMTADYNTWKDEFQKWRDTVNSTLANQAGRVATWGVVMLIAIAVANILMKFLWK